MSCGSYSYEGSVLTYMHQSFILYVCVLLHRCETVSSCLELLLGFNAFGSVGWSG